MTAVLKFITSALLLFSVVTALADDAEIYTVGYVVPPTFLSAGGSGKGMTAQQVLEAAGVKFTEGAAVLGSPPDSRVFIRNTAEQHRVIQKYIDTLKTGDDISVNISSEIIEVEFADFTKWMFENRIGNQGTKLRKQAQVWLKAGRGRLIDTSLIRCRSGNRGTGKSVIEHIYSTESDPPEAPNEVELDEPVAVRALITGPTPTAFEVRELGEVFKVDAEIIDGGRFIKLAISREHSKLGEVESDWPHNAEDPFFTISMPRFESLKTMTQLSVAPDKYHLISIMRPQSQRDSKRTKPILLHFIRAVVIRS